MSSSPHKTWEKIAAFADGELSGEECCDLLKEAMDQPDHAQCVEYQQQLRKLMAGCMDCEKTMRCPDELKNCIEGLADEHCTDATKDEAVTPAAVTSTQAPLKASPSPSVIARIGQWAPLAVAAALFIAAIGVYQGARNTPGGSVEAGLLPVALVSEMEARHVRCTSGATPLYMNEAFPTDIELLDEALTDRFGPEMADAALDLSSIGYAYRVAGLCTVPGRGAVHVVYTSNTPDPHGRQRSLSLWIKPYNAETDPAIEPGDMHTAADDKHAHPIVVWRDAAMIYYLVGDAMHDVEQAGETLSL